MKENLIQFNTANLDNTLFSVYLQQAAGTDVLKRIDELLVTVREYHRELLSACMVSIESHGLVDSSDLSAYLSDPSAWRRTNTGIWLVARLLELKGEIAAALVLWDFIIAQQIGDIHEAHLSRARLHSRTGHVHEAFADVKESLQNEQSYGFLIKVTKLYQRLKRQAVPQASRTIRLALLSSTTTDLIASLLQLACFRDGIDAEIYNAPYGNFRQEILDPESGLYQFGPDFVIIATNWRDAHLPAFTDKPFEQVANVVDELKNLWQTLLNRLPCRIIQHNFDMPRIDPYGHLSRSLSGGMVHMLRQANSRLVEIAPPAVAILDVDYTSGKYGKDKWQDSIYWYMAKQYPAADALPLLVDYQVALIRAGLGLTRKVLVLDLDNTLWGGVIGEDGLEGIRLGPPSASGEAYQALQQYILSLKDRGILLAVCSKNNEADAKLPFQEHDATILRLDDFVLFIANWVDKPTNLRQMAQRLNLGIDSFVFLDDNPVERALVRREIPDIAVPEVGPDPATFVETLERGLYFEAWTLSEEDKERHQSYRANVLRDELATTASSIEDFLDSLHMQAEMSLFTEKVLPRVVQLIGKTNQFNLTNRRHSEEQVRRMMSEGSWTQYFKLKDRFGDNGLVGVMIAHQIPSDALTWEIDTWLMSCRVIGRQMEQFMLQTLVEAAAAAGVCMIRGVYVPTAKNKMVSDLYERMGFEKKSVTDAGVFYELDLSAHTIVGCRFIKTVYSPSPIEPG